MKTFTLFLFITCFHFSSSATGWRFIGPDSTHWRNIAQMDVSFRTGRSPYIGVGTTRGICMTSGATWNYVLQDYSGRFFPPEDVMYRSVYFSPWDDSVGFVGYNIHYTFEPGSLGGRVPNIHLGNWGFPWQIGGGYVGYSPSLSFEFSPHHPNHAYSWIIDLYKSSDNGLSWQHQQNVDSYGVLFISFDQNKDSVLYIGRKPVSQSAFGVYRSTDDGTSWTFVRPLSITASYPFQRVAELLADGDTLVLATNHFPASADTTCGISVSSDQGTSWSQVLAGVNVQKITRDQLLPNVWYAAVQGGIYRSVNGGIGWHLYTDSLPSLNLVDIRKDPYSDTLYVATSDSGVYKVFDVTAAVREEREMPVTHNLHQNYPNPFNPTTIIEYDIRREGRAELSIYSTLGQKVRTVVDEEKAMGSYQVVWDGKNDGGYSLPSGAYFYQLRVGEFTSARRMVLVK